MKLTELFKGEKQITDQGKSSQAISVKNDVVNRQIRSMVPGQTIQGEVVSKNGNEVQIRVTDEVILQARLDKSMNLEVGKMMTFEVKNNGKALTLSPLFTNVATDANVLKALDMASLPVNDTTVEIAKQLMAAGLSINRTALQQVFREVNMFPQSQVSDIVNLHKLQLPVNEANVNQMASYRNLTHQLMSGLNHILDGVPELFTQMMESGNTEGAVKLYQQLSLLANEGNMMEGNLLVNQGTATDGAVTKTVITEGTTGAVVGETAMTETDASDKALTKAVINSSLEMPQGAESSGKAEGTATVGMSGGNTENGVTQGGDAFTIAMAAQPEEAMLTQHFTDLLEQLAKGTATPDDLAQLSHHWKEIGGDKEVMKPVLNLLKHQWTITPAEVAKPGNVEKLYDKMQKQIKQLAQTMEGLGQHQTPAYKATVNLVQNLDFMQQMNQMYAYVQLPLRLQNGEAHGDLYVYSNKKHLASEDGQVSALLHLDMEYLGPVDVYVSMKQNDVKTQFYLKDDEMLDFLMAHIDILTERIQKRGYQCECEMKVREDGAGENSSIHKMFLQEKQVPLAEYAFDVRT